MGNETTKSKNLRSKNNHFNLYLHGDGLDIGAGDDPLNIEDGSVDTWDWQNGDAQYIQLPKLYDFVYSSHCLEHMQDVNIALKHWCALIKPGGYLYITVPDWVLYEHRNWPSIFNGDHKHTFSISEEFSSPTHYTKDSIKDMLSANNVEFIDIGLEDENFDYSLPEHIDQTCGSAVCQIRIIGKKL